MLAATTSEQGALSMPRIIAFHDVKDVSHWLSSPLREEFFGPRGVTEIQTYVDPEGSNRVGLSMHVPDLNALMADIQAGEVNDAMEHDGVIPESLVILVES
jgi:hypothetical protein